MDGNKLLLLKYRGSSTQVCESFEQYLARMARANLCSVDLLVANLIEGVDAPIRSAKERKLCIDALSGLIPEGIVDVMAGVSDKHVVRWCPECLFSQGEKHHRLAWQLSDCCELHGRPLVSICPHCWFQTKDVLLWLENDGCPRCGGDLTDPGVFGRASITHPEPYAFELNVRS